MPPIKASTNTRRFPAYAGQVTVSVRPQEVNTAASYEASAETTILYRCSDGLLQKADLSITSRVYRRRAPTYNVCACTADRILVPARSYIAANLFEVQPLSRTILYPFFFLLLQTKPNATSHVQWRSRTNDCGLQRYLLCSFFGDPTFGFKAT